MDFKTSPKFGLSGPPIAGPFSLHRMSTQPLSSARIFSTVEYNDCTLCPLPFQALKTAWAVLLAEYTNSPRAVFGTVSGITTSRGVLEEWICHVDQEMPLPEAVSIDKCREWRIEEAPFGQCFNTCIVEGNKSSDGSIELLLEALDSIDLIILLDHQEPFARINMYSRESFLDQRQFELLQDALRHILICLTSKGNTPLGSTNLVSRLHYLQIQTWNQMAPAGPLDDCIHHFILRQRHRNPFAEAVCAWDGTFTYQELDDASSDIHRALFHKGIRPGCTIPLLFEKSKWTVVAMLGVLKSGAAFVLLDPTLPENRLRTIREDVEAPFVLSSIKQQCIASRVHHSTITVPTPASSPLSDTKYLEPLGSSHHSAYIAYTSGSTGNPKGIIISHGAFCTNAILSSASQCLEGQSRVLQFASYAFDVSIHETLVPLMHGGCVCIPSDSQRVNNLHGAILDLRVDWVELIPSVARLLDFDTLPAVKTLVVGGETMRPGDIDQLSRRLHLIQAYGPAECTVVSTVHSHLSHGSDPSNIGHSPAGSCWLVEPDDHQRLVPIGAVGELIIGGPIVGKGYLNRPEESSRSFITNPPWSSSSQPHYKTGDLARQHSDGSIVYMGRKDTQVKIRGQRVELGEVEHQAQQICPGSTIVAEAVSIDQREKTLILFIGDLQHGLGAEREASLFMEPDATFRDSMRKVQARLKELLPEYLIPAAFVPLRQIPLMPSGKIDRREIRASAASLSSKDLQRFRPQCLSSADPTNPPKMLNSEAVHMHLRQLFSQILELHDEVSDDDDFFFLGGDSSLAIALVNRARLEHNIEITVASIFQNPTVSRLAQVAQRTTTGPRSSRSLAPFSLIPPDDVKRLNALVMQQCGINQQDVEDIYPATPLQERLISWTFNKPGAFQAEFVFSLPSTVDWDRLLHAWRVVVRAHPILRTRIILNDSPLCPSRGLQVVVRDDTAWEHISRDANDNSNHMTTGTSLVHLTTSSGSVQTLTLRIHHALFDIWSYNEIIGAVEAAYNGSPATPTSFAPFIEKLTTADEDAARQFWTNEYDSLHAPAFPARVPPGYTPQEVQCWTSRIPLNRARPQGITISTVCRLAWAMVIAHYTNSQDTIFGVTVTGRYDFETASVVGPTTTTFPLRIQLQRSLKIHDTLRNIQEHATETMPYEHFGVHQIRKCSPEAVIASQFQSLLVVQPMSKSSSRHTSGWNLLELIESEAFRQQSHSSFATQALTVICEPSTDNLDIQMVFDPTIVSSSMVEDIFQRMRGYLDTIMSSPTDTLATLLLDHSEIEPENGMTQKEKPPFELPRSNGNHILSKPSANNAACVSEIESALQSIMARVLRLDEKFIGTNDSFFTLGGDSLLAMQVVAQCRDNDIILSTHDIFDAKTISAMALRSSKRLSSDQSLNPANSTRSSYGCQNLESFKSRTRLSDKLFAQVEDAYLCTQSHQGLLTDGASSDYLSYTLWEVSRPGHQIDVDRLALSWRRLSTRHTALRTILCADTSTEGTIHLVLHSPPTDVRVVSGIKDEELTSMLHIVQLPRQDEGIVPCQFTIYQTQSTKIFCRLEGSHTSLDATSIIILLTELSLSYDNNLSSSPGPSYRSWVTYLAHWNEDPHHLNYWKCKLSGLRPCLFPRLCAHDNTGNNSIAPPQLHTITHTVSDTKLILDFCNSHEITATTLLQSAWALVLQEYCKSSDICFGTTVSGRDAPLPHIQDIVGSLFNVLPCRIQLSPDLSAMDMLRTNQKDLQERTLHQFCSLADLESLVQSTSRHMFNTCFSVERTLSCGDETGLSFNALETHEETRNDLISTVTLLPQKAEMQLMYWSEFLDERNATRIAANFRMCVLQMLNDPAVCLADIRFDR